MRPRRQNLLLADRYRDGNVSWLVTQFILSFSTGGLGMNTGVGDAFDLAWKLIGPQGWVVRASRFLRNDVINR